MRSIKLMEHSVVSVNTLFISEVRFNKVNRALVVGIQPALKFISEMK